MRIFTASLSTETNTFSPIPTGIDSFKARGYHPAGQHPDTMLQFSGPLWAARQRARAHGWTVIEGTVAGAVPAGLTTRYAYETLRDEILQDLRNAGQVDMVVLGLHGAMVADGYDDCEGDLISRVREIVGPAVVIGAELDPHCHMTPLMYETADVLVCFKEYPHTDILERAYDLVDLCAAKVRGEASPTLAVYDCEMISIMHTSREPMRSFVDRLLRMEQEPGILSISIAHGFPWGDVPGMGSKVLVYTDGDAARATQLARELGEEIIGFRDALQTPNPTTAEAIRLVAENGRYPAVLADSADNAGGGAGSDSTFVLADFLAHQVRDAVIGPIWDPVAVSLCMNAGEGAALALRVGGKVSPASGQPVDVHCVVKALKRNAYMTGLSNTPSLIGDVAVVEAEGITMVLNTVRNQAVGRDLFTQFGIDLAQCKYIVVKSSQHFYADFSKVAAQVIYLRTPGSVSSDLHALPYRKITYPKWPLVTPAA
ncbi:microcystin LR degradation protein MlrC-like protein [Bordetella genomosp. 7]|uniref:M81 family metallopeptidase n=1 Tax=Bordetella TaxID=517 RepID=UPI00047C0DF4|nr:MULTISPECIES: M81 family metallopeptidase [Bordetella]OZI22045.1 microcystin LR degradation protein MlrC-like protein [Bordetella genomosp. 7]